MHACCSLYQISRQRQDSISQTRLQLDYNASSLHIPWAEIKKNMKMTMIRSCPTSLVISTLSMHHLISPLRSVDMQSGIFTYNYEIEQL